MPRTTTFTVERLFPGIRFRLVKPNLGELAIMERELGKRHPDWEFAYAIAVTYWASIRRYQLAHEIRPLFAWDDALLMDMDDVEEFGEDEPEPEVEMVPDPPIGATQTEAPDSSPAIDQ